MKLKDLVPATQVAAWINAEIVGDGQTPVTGLNEIHNVEKGDMTFVDHEKYYDFTLKSAASVIIVNKKIENPDGKTLLIHPHPFAAYNLLAAKFHPLIFSEQRIAATAQIGDETVVSSTASIGDRVTIGKRCVIHPQVTIYPYTQIGDDVIIHANTCIGADAFYYKRQSNKRYDKMHTAGRVVIGTQVEIGAGCTIDAGVSSDTVIGRGTKIDDQVHIGHDVKIGEDCILAGQVGIAGNTKIGNRVTLYGKVAVNKNIEIGDDAVVLATAAVPHSLGGGKVYGGAPAIDARIFSRQLAIIKKLPELWEKLRQL